MAKIDTEAKTAGMEYGPVGYIYHLSSKPIGSSGGDSAESPPELVVVIQY